MNAQKQLLGVGGSVLALAGMISKLTSKKNEKHKNSAKKGYEKAANTKKENNELIKKNIEQVTEKKAPQPFGELVGVEDTFKQTDAPAEKEIVEAKKPVQGFGALSGEEAPAQKQKFILSEEDAYFPVTAENSETKIPVDEDVKGLIEVKQKNALRAAAGKRNADKQEELVRLYAQKHHRNEYDRAATKNFLKDLGFNKSAADYKAVGLDKHELNSFAIAEGEEYGEQWASFITSNFRNMKAKYSNNKDALDYLDIQQNAFQNKHGSLVQEEDADWNKDLDFQQLVLDFDQLVDDMKSGKYKEFMKKYKGTDEDMVSENWYDNFTRDTGTYKVWDDTEEELPETDRSFSGIVF